MTTELPVPIEDWQEDFDEWFPKGAVVIRMSDDPDGDDPTYTTPQITAHEEPLVFAAADTDGQLWRFSNSISDKLAAVLAVNRGDEVLSRVYVLAMIS
jgi:hypothetical protein